MENFIRIILCLTLIAFIYKGLKNKYFIGLIFIGISSSMVTGAIGLDSYKTFISYFIIFFSLSIYLIYEKNICIYSYVLLPIFILLLYCIIILIASFNSPAINSDYFGLKMRNFIILSLFPALLILIIGNYKKGEIVFVEYYIISISTIFATWLFIDFLNSKDVIFYSLWFQRKSLGIINPIWLARFMGIGFLILQSKRYQKNLFISLILSTFIIMTSLLTGSKIVLFIILPIGIFLRIRDGFENKKILINIVSITTLIFTIGYFLEKFNIDSVIRRLSFQSQTINYRIDYIKMTFNSFLESNHYIFGNGFATIGRALGQHYSRSYPHNVPLELLYEAGVIGLAIYFLPILFVVTKYVKSNYRSNWIFYAYIACVLFSFCSGDLMSNNYVYLYFALFVISKNNIKNDSKI